MSLHKQSDVKNHLSHRTRSGIHLIQPTSQPGTTGLSGVEQLEGPAAPAVTPVENCLDHVPKEYEALRDFLISESPVVSKAVQE